MKLSISVMAHPKRAEHFAYLNRALGDVKFSIDEGIGIWENCKRAWRMRDPKAEWHVVIQDDAIVCENFRERAEKAIADAESKGCEFVSFFFGTRIMMEKAQKDAVKNGYWTSGWIHWGLAICMKVDRIESVIAFGDKQKIPQDDARIANYVRHNKLKVYYPMPSLVDHRIGESLVGDKGRGRKAFRFIDDVKEYPWGKMEWPERAQAVAKRIPARSNVVDVGGGYENLKKYLDRCKYVSIDKEKWTPETVVGDFNKGEFPEIGNSEQVGDYVVVQGVLEYIEKPLTFLKEIKKYGRKLILTYNFSRNKLKQNDLSLAELEGLIHASGWEIDTVDSNLMRKSNQIIYELRK